MKNNKKEEENFSQIEEIRMYLLDVDELNKLRCVSEISNRCLERIKLIQTTENQETKSFVLEDVTSLYEDSLSS